MSTYYFRQYGYGVNISKLKAMSADKITELLKSSLSFKDNFNTWLKTQESTENLTLKQLSDFGFEYYNGLGSILAHLISTEYKIMFYSCVDLYDQEYVLYLPDYPWLTLEREKNLQQEDIDKVLIQFFRQITDEEIEIDYQNPECTG